MKKNDRESEAKCALCLNVAELRKSHIIPEFFYDLVYDERHRFLKISSDTSKRIVSVPQGIYERLLCGRCEGRIGVWETYASKVIMGGTGLYIQPQDWGFTVLGVEYAPFKLFGMSLLWRAAVSRRPEFFSVQLGPHEEKLRKMLDAEDPGQLYEYGFYIVFSPDPSAREAFDGAISPPQRFRNEPHDIYRFILGLTIWDFVVSDQMHTVKPEFFSLHSNGTLQVRSGGEYITEFLRDFSTEIGDAKARRNVTG